MNEIVRLGLLVVLAGAGLTVIGSMVAWTLNETRQIRRAFKKVLGAEADVLLIAPGRGRGTGLNFKTDLCAVAWDAGAWCLIYRIDELMGAELIIDHHVVARTFRGEPRRALEQVVTQASRVTLRLIFDDAHHPDFELDLWQAGDETRRATGSSASAVQEANRWLARTEAILRRPQVPPQTAPVIATRELAPAPWNHPADGEDDLTETADT